MNQFTGQGLLVRFEERQVGQNGHKVSSGTIVLSAPRRKNKQTGQWESQGDGTFIDFEAWNLSPAKVQFLGANIKNSLVTIVGRLQQDNWTDNQSGQKRSRIKVCADVVDAKIKPQRQNGGGGGGQAQAQAQPSQDTVSNTAGGGATDPGIPF